MDNELIMCDISVILRQHNKLRGGISSDEAVERIRELVTPKGKWIEKEDYAGDTYYDCSNCGNSWSTLEGTPWQNGMSFCPNCGARMEDPNT